MSEDVVIRVDNLGKAYTIRHQTGRAQGHHTYERLSEELQNWAAWPFRKLKDRFQKKVERSDVFSKEEFWALKNVSFEVRQGEIVGIIGRNGAGKSTLLKILSRIIDPTSGRVEIDGRVASLLEVGTGFHPELTGRENIFLNGAILGMTRQEIKRKFHEIVAFSEVEKFIDTPVKHYSSGMYVRLAFAVAAHLEPAVLVIDEVLAVGDAAFQKKCLEKVREVGKQGKTVLFVSHNLQAVRQLCDRAVFLRAGELVADAGAAETIEYYLQEGDVARVEQSLAEIIANLPTDPAFMLKGVSLTQNGKLVGAVVESGKPLEVEIYYRILSHTTGLRIYVDLCDDQGIMLFRSFHDEEGNGIPVVEPGSYTSRLVIPANILGPTSYELRVRSGIFNVRSCLPAAGIRLPIRVELTGRYNQAYFGDTFRGKLALALDWFTERQN